MAKGKNANPADAYRKAQRKKELKKNKAERSKARDFALVKKDTRDIEEEIEKLEASPDSDKARLAELKKELEKINKKKEEYVAEHPEHRKLVYKARRRDNEKEEETEKIIPQKRNLFNKRGLPRHPERSVYYDPVFNPYGVPPPGMPYIERPLRPNEVDSDAEAAQDSDDEIAMPAGPPPGPVLGENDQLIEDDEDIPMPDDPPPPKDDAFVGTVTPLPPLPPVPANIVPPPLPPGVPLPGMPGALLPPFPPGMPIPPPPPGFGMPNLPPPPPPPGFGIPNFPPPPPPPGFSQFTRSHPQPPPPPGFSGAVGSYPPPAPFPQMPPPPPGFFPRKTQSVGSVQDPLSSIPHQTFQAHRASRIQPHPSLPPKPVTQEVSAAATISAEPELRDLKKEATSFVPAALRKKKNTGPTSKINAAPTVEVTDAEPGPQATPRPDLMSTLKSQFGSTPGFADVKIQPAVGKPKDSVGKSKDDYEKFLAEMGDVLGAPPS